MAKRIAPDSRIIVIGSGVVGAALADDLTRSGQTAVTVVDQGPLFRTGGSSSHAPGFAFQTTGAEVMTLLAKRTLDKLDGVELDGQWVLKRVGGLELACDEEHAQYLRRRFDLAQSWGVPARLVTPEESARLFPGLDPSEVILGLHTPTDGVVKSVRAVEWQARRAITNGAVFYGHTKVTGFRIVDGRVTGVEVARTPEVPSNPSQGETLPDGIDFLPADIVVVCAGLWGPELAELIGVELPMVPMEHCETYTTALPSLRGFDPAEEIDRPMLRHQRTGSYLRQSGETYLWGSYEHTVLPVEQHQIASPEEYSRTGLEPAIHEVTWDELDHGWDDVRRLLPETAQVELVEGINGIFSFTPDGNPLLGPVTGVEGLWFAESVWLTQSAGVAQVMADWIITGDPGVDTRTLDYRRFDQTQLTRAVSVALACESYDDVYDIAHPRKQTRALRGFSTTPFYLRQEQLGAVFAVRDGSERPLWYRRRTAASTPYASTTDWAGYGTAPEIDEEASAAIRSAALLDAAHGLVLEVSGAGAEAHLGRLAAQPLPASDGDAHDTLLLDEHGRITAEVTITRTSPDGFLVLAPASVDRWIIEAESPRDVSVTDRTSATAALTVAGPRASELLATLARDGRAPETGPSHGRIDVAGVPVRVVPDASLGVPAWTLLARVDHGLFLWDALIRAGVDIDLVPAGAGAREVLRIDAGTAAFGRDFGRGTTPNRVRRDTDPVDEGRVLVRLRLADGADAIVADEPVLDGDEVVGYVTTAARSPRDGHFRAFAWVDAHTAADGTVLTISYLGRRIPSTVDRTPVPASALAQA